MAKRFITASFLAIATFASAIPQVDQNVPSQAQSGTGNPAPRRLLGNSFAAPGDASYEYIVVGAGNAGLPLAVRLSEGGHTVALIEAGSFYEIGNSNYSQIPVLAPAFSGKDINSVSPQVDWSFQTVPQQVCRSLVPNVWKALTDLWSQGQGGQTPLYARGKTLGGSSARNFMAYHRGTIGSYKQWADQVGDDSYLWEKIQPYFEKSVNFTAPSEYRFPNATPQYDLSTLGDGSGPLQITYGAYAWAFGTWGKKALAAIGIPERKGFTSGGLFGSSNQLLTVDATQMTRDSSETSFLRKLGLQNPNLVVYPNTLAKRILFDNDKNAVGISIDFAGRNYTLNATREVIASAGAFQSPQLLMVSGVGPQSTLERFGIPVVANRPGVGQNLWDHTLGGPSYRLNLETYDDFAKTDFAIAATQEYNSYPPHGPYASVAGDVLGKLFLPTVLRSRILADPSSAFEKLPRESRSRLSNYTLQSLATYPSDWPELEYLVIPSYLGPDVSILGAGPNGHNYGSIQVALVAPFSRGNISIQSSDMHDHPLINPAWLTDTRDQEVAVAGYKRVRQMFNSTALRPIVIGSEVYPGRKVSSYAQILKQIQKDFGTVWHASCTCKMGRANDTMAVVDSKANVIGVKGLKVVDASSFALLPPGHPMATVCEFVQHSSFGSIVLTQVQTCSLRRSLMKS